MESGLSEVLHSVETASFNGSVGVQLVFDSFRGENHYNSYNTDNTRRVILVLITLDVLRN